MSRQFSMTERSNRFTDGRAAGGQRGRPSRGSGRLAELATERDVRANIVRASRYLFSLGQSECEVTEARPFQDTRDRRGRKHRPLDLEAENGAGITKRCRPVSVVVNDLQVAGDRFPVLIQ